MSATVIFSVIFSIFWVILLLLKSNVDLSWRFSSKMCPRDNSPMQERRRTYYKEKMVPIRELDLLNFGSELSPRKTDSMKSMKLVWLDAIVLWNKVNVLIKSIPSILPLLLGMTSAKGSSQCQSPWGAQGHNAAGRSTAPAWTPAELCLSTMLTLLLRTGQAPAVPDQTSSLSQS